MPVLPEVGSTSTVSGPISPAVSMSSTMATPIRSLTLAAGLRNSSLARMLALTPCISGKRTSLTIGVSPMASMMEPKTRPRPGFVLDFARAAVRVVVAIDMRLFKEKALADVARGGNHEQQISSAPIGGVKRTKQQESSHHAGAAHCRGASPGIAAAIGDRWLVFWSHAHAAIAGRASFPWHRLFC